jgi:hypothetical protein
MLGTERDCDAVAHRRCLQMAANLSFDAIARAPPTYSFEGVLTAD